MAGPRPRNGMKVAPQSGSPPARLDASPHPSLRTRCGNAAARLHFPFTLGQRVLSCLQGTLLPSSAMASSLCFPLTIRALLESRASGRPARHPVEVTSHDLPACLGGARQQDGDEEFCAM